MTAQLLGRFDAQSPEWYAAREAGLGGSEIAAVLGLSKWDSRFSLWHRKAGNVPLQDDNTDMEWGRRLEPVIAAKFCEDHPELVPIIGGTYVNAERPWQVANPDLLLGPACDCDGPIHDCDQSQPTAVLEVKTSRYADEWGAPGTDEVPPYYLVQCRWYLDVLGVDRAYLAVLIGGSEYREYVIEPDDADTELMRTAGAEFMESLRLGIAPNIDEHSATYETVRKLHPGIDGTDVEIPARLARWYLSAVAACSAAERRKRKHAAAVADRIGNARRAVSDGRTIAIRVPGRGDNPPFLRPTSSKESA
jgi:putative phage-type endonuclease